jgi:hypothetical protein
MSEPIYALGNKCRTLHIIPGMTFSPSLCGFIPTANRGGKPTWSVFEKEVALSRVTVQIRVCEVCEKLHAEASHSSSPDL